MTETRTLSLRKNRELLISGYFHENSVNNSIPDDIVKYVFKFYDNAILWVIDGDGMDTFYKCKNRDVLYGPSFEPINGFLCELTLCPNGWSDHEIGFVICYLEVKSIAKYIKNISVSITFYLKELKYESLKSISYHPDSKIKANGWSYGVLFENIKKKNFKSLHMSCIVDIIHVQYTKSSKMKNIITLIPDIRNTTFIWNIGNKLLNKLKNTNGHQPYFSDCFSNNCWRLKCLPNGRPMTKGYLMLFIELVQMPSKLKSINVKYDITAYCDDQEYIKHDTKRFTLDSDTKYKNNQNLKVEDSLFPSSTLQNISNLSFFIKIEIDYISLSHILWV